MITQTLIKRKDGNGRIAAHEIMTGNAAIRALIRENKVAQMHNTMVAGREDDMQTLDFSLKELVRRNLVTSAEAKLKAVNKKDF